MREEYFPVDSLKPAQWGYRRSTISKLVGEFSREKFDSIPVIVLRESIVMGGGHNRAFFTYLVQKAYGKRTSVKIRIVESDEEIVKYFDAGFKKFTCSSFANNYRSFLYQTNFDFSAPRNVADLRCDITAKSPGKIIEVRGGRVYEKPIVPIPEKEDEFIGVLPSLEQLTGNSLDAHSPFRI